MLDRAALLEDLRRHAFATSAGPPLIGGEVEFLVLTDEGRPVPISAPQGPASLPLLRQVAEGQEWREEATPHGAPRWLVPEQGIVTFEPGGQLEFSTLPKPSLTELVAALDRVTGALRETAERNGVVLLGSGIDPLNPVERIPLRLAGARYGRMAEYLATIGPAGARMMRQTASIQVNVDWGPAAEASLRWRVLNAAAPYVLAIFANSPLYEGKPTGHRSYRAAQWRELDPTRTGVFAPSDEPVREYLDWALAAPAILLDSDGTPPFATALEQGATLAEWRTHLSTLFPEIRPKGFVEVRSPDALPPEWYVAPFVLLAGIAYDPEALRTADALLGDADAELLAAAGERGLADPRIAAKSRQLWEIAFAGCRRLGTRFVDGATLERAADFAARYTARGRSPADDEVSAPAP